MNKDKQSYKNKNDHSGYQPYELYIEPKYKDIKDEILNNTIFQLNIKQLNISINKALQYKDTMRCRNTKSTKECEIIHHYGIAPGTPLQFKYIIAIILYTDWSDLCTKFSSTFRKLKPYEPIESVKDRNREYAIWSKTLRETVEYFGQMGWEMDKDKKWNNDNNRVKGPFFCGMSVMMVIPEFNIRYK